METVNEGTTSYLEIVFKNEAGVGVTPLTATYRIDDVLSGTAIRAITPFSPSSPTYVLRIAEGDNKILDTTKEYEERLVTLTYTYTDTQSQTATRNAEYNYKVKNLKKIVS